MQPGTIDQWRAHLLVASMVGTVIQAGVLVCILLLRVPEGAFTQPAFRVGVVVTVVLAVLLVRRFARAAFRAAIAGRHARTGSEQDGTIFLSPHCPQRILVVLYMRFNRQQFY